MQVKLLNATPKPDETVYRAARVCYSEDFYPFEESPDESEIKRLLAHLSSSGHFSVFEHISFTFAISGISRVTTHQLVRHRIASYSQQSQRYVSSSNQSIVVPPSIKDNPENFRNFSKFMNLYRSAMNLYNEMIENGIPKEDARYILPHGMESKITVTMNASALMAFFSKRLCERAQWEIRECALKMLDLVSEIAPLTFALAGPPCKNGPCPEKRPCGKH